MAYIRMDFKNVVNTNFRLSGCRQSIEEAKSTIRSVENAVDGEVFSEDGSIGSRIDSSIRRLNEVSSRIENLYNFVNSSVNAYSNAEYSINEKGRAIGE